MFLKGLVLYPAPLVPTGGEPEVLIEGWNIQQIWHPDGVHLYVIIFQPELECSNFLDANAQSYPINLVVLFNRLEVVVKLVCAVCHAVQSVTINTHQI